MPPSASRRRLAALWRDERIKAIIALSQALHLDVTGEGVETLHQVTELKSLGCDTAQGYYFARPQSADSVGALLETGSAVA